MLTAYPFASYPFLRYTLALAAGILTYIYCPWPWKISLGLFIASCLVSFLLFYFSKHKALRLGALGLICLYFAGHLFAALHKDTINADHLMHLQGKTEALEILLTDPPEPKKKSLLLKAKVLAAKANGQWQKVQGKILVYVRPDSSTTPFQYGDRLLVRAQLQALQPPGNPGEFDYRAYLSHQQVYHQCFVSGRDCRLLKQGEGSWPLEYAYSIRDYCDNVLRRTISSEREYKIASALLLGIRNSLDNELKAAYSATGAMHVLAVSGLHVAIIYQLLLLVLGGLSGQTRKNYLFTSLLILALWLYALITGFSPSVLRSVVMFSALLIGRSLGRHSSIVNSLALSAFILLLFNPYYIMDVGFQLSYAAVGGIIVWYPFFHKQFSFTSWWARQLWAITCVSLAAQLATFPIGLLYFHQFPTWFLFSNLVIIPISFVVLYAGVALFCFSWIPGLDEGLGWVVEKTIWLQNQSVFLFEQLPYTLLQPADISIAETWLIYALIVCLYLFFYYKKLSWLYTATALALSLSLIQVSEQIIQSSQNYLVWYKVKNHRTLAGISGREAWLWCDSALSRDESKIRFHITHHLWHRGISEPQISDFPKSHASLPYGRLAVWQGRTILFLEQTQQLPVHTIPLKIDYLYIDRLKPQTLQKINACFSYQQLICGHLASDSLASLAKIHCLGSEGALEIALP